MCIRKGTMSNHSLNNELQLIMFEAELVKMEIEKLRSEINARISN
jgi:hypothetical protein